MLYTYQELSQNFNEEMVSSSSSGFILGSWQTNLGQLDALLPPTGLCGTIDLCQDVVILHLQFTLESIKYKTTFYYLVTTFNLQANKSCFVSNNSVTLRTECISSHVTSSVSRDPGSRVSLAHG